MPTAVQWITIHPTVVTVRYGGWKPYVIASYSLIETIISKTGKRNPVIGK